MDRARHTWNKGSGELKSISMTPPEYAFTKTGQTGQLSIKATFTDGSEENITPLCDYRTNDDSVATVDPLGQVKAVRAGDTAIIVLYRGQVLPVRHGPDQRRRPAFSIRRFPKSTMSTAKCSPS